MNRSSRRGTRPARAEGARCGITGSLSRSRSALAVAHRRPWARRRQDDRTGRVGQRRAKRARNADGRAPRRHAQAAREGRRRLARPAGQLHARSTGSSTRRTLRRPASPSRRRAATKAFTIVPDLADAIPKPTDGGKTWTFKLRKGIKFSNGQRGRRRATCSHSFQRIFKVQSPTAGGFYSVLVGADECLKTPATCTSRRASWSTRRPARSRST